MSNIFEYKGYQGSVEFSAEDALLFGKVLFINDSIMFHGSSVEEVENAFHEVVDNYLLFCKEQGVEPDQPFKGTFNVRIGPELHRSAALASTRLNLNLNEFVRDAVAEKINRLNKKETNSTVHHHHYHVSFNKEIRTVPNQKLYTEITFPLDSAGSLSSNSRTSVYVPSQTTLLGN